LCGEVGRCQKRKTPKTPKAPPAAFRLRQSLHPDAASSLSLRAWLPVKVFSAGKRFKHCSELSSFHAHDNAPLTLFWALIFASSLSLRTVYDKSVNLDSRPVIHFVCIGAPVPATRQGHWRSKESLQTCSRLLHKTRSCLITSKAHGLWTIRRE
jgi:hypothetical protein